MLDSMMSSAIFCVYHKNIRERCKKTSRGKKDNPRLRRVGGERGKAEAARPHVMPKSRSAVCRKPASGITGARCAADAHAGHSYEPNVKRINLRGSASTPNRWEPILSCTALSCQCLNDGENLARMLAGTAEARTSGKPQIDFGCGSECSMTL